MNCSACSLKYQCVRATGPRPARILCIGERPGVIENAKGYCFCGPTGEEWDYTYLPLAGLRRQDVMVTNTVLCWAENNRKPTAKEIAACSQFHLPAEIAATKPEIIILMGGTACSLIPDINLEVEHGIPRWGELFGWKGWVVPMDHPAKGLHDTTDMIRMLEDWERLKNWLLNPKQFWPWAVDIFKDEVDYKLIRSVNELDQYFLKYRPVQKISCIDTESHGGREWSIQFSIRPGTGRMVLLNPKVNLTGAVLAALPYWLDQYLITFHNAPADLPITENLRYGESLEEYRDTMQEAYHLGNLPQGLKALGYRLCGVKMKSWEEVVGEASRVALFDWMTARIQEEELRPVVEQVQLKTKVKEVRKPNEIEKKLRHVQRYMLTGSEEYDPWERLRAIPELSGYPVKGIANCSLEEAVKYGCRDADVGLRVALELERRRTRIVEEEWRISEDDWDRVGEVVREARMASVVG